LPSLSVTWAIKPFVNKQALIINKNLFFLLLYFQVNKYLLLYSRIHVAFGSDGIIEKLSIPEATNRKPVPLIVVGHIVVGPDDTAIEVVQEAVPGVRSIDPRRTPPDAGVTNIAECTIEVTSAARQACKTAAISGSGIIAAIPNLSLSCIR